MLNEDELRKIAMRTLVAAMLAADRAVVITGEDPTAAIDRAIAEQLALETRA